MKSQQKWLKDWNIWHDERLRELELFNLKIRMLRVDLISLYKCLMGHCKEDTTRAGLLVLSDRTIGSSLKLKPRKFHLDMLKKEKVGFVCIEFWLFVGFSILLLVITNRNRLLREVVKFPPRGKGGSKAKWKQH